MLVPIPQHIDSKPSEFGATDLDLATNPETTPVALSRMAMDCAANETLAEALALNPNTPLPDLFRLWCKHPFAALENPITTFQTLCTGRLLYQFLPREVQHRLYVALRSSHRAAELEEHLLVEARLRWLTGPEPDIGWFFRSPGGGIARNPRDADEAERIRSEDAFALRFFELLGQDPASAVRKEMVTRLPFHSLQAYLNEPLVEIRLELATRVTSNHGGRGVEEHRVLEIMRDALSRDHEEVVRCRVAAGDAIQNPVFERLAHDPSFPVLLALAGGRFNPQTMRCGAAWQTLAETHTDLAMLVALNDSCPAKVRLKLIEHSDAHVRKNAWSKMEFRNLQLRRRLVRMAESFLHNPSSHPELETIAANPSIPACLAAKLAKIEGPLARIVTANPKLPETERRRLLGGSCVSTARVAASHATENETLWTALRHPAESVRTVLVKKQGIHAVRIRFQLAKDPSLTVRRELIKHLVDPKNEDPLDRKFGRQQLRLLLDSATPTEKDLFLRNKPLRRLLAQWRLEATTTHPTPCK
jgi:hypothetical protein